MLLWWFLPLVIGLLYSLSGLCPKCGKRVVFNRSVWGTASILTSKPCPRCKFKFERTPDSEIERELDREKKYFSEYLFPYLPLGIFSLVLATIGTFGYTYLKTKQASFDTRSSVFLSLVGLIFLLLLFVTRGGDKFSKCSICGAPGKDNLEDGNGKSKRLCRTHLIEEFERAYSRFDKKMVVIHPDLEERKKSCYAYQYYTNEEIGKYKLADVVGKLTKQGLSSISGNCQKCSASAKIAFFDKGTFRWEDDFPKLEEIDQSPDLLCRQCAFRAFRLIKDSLHRFQGYFGEPVIPPHKDEGILMPWTF